MAGIVAGEPRRVEFFDESAASRALLCDCGGNAKLAPTLIQKVLWDETLQPR
jgi:hypothetical protein